jgi:hypothetical protein
LLAHLFQILQFFLPHIPVARSKAVDPQIAVGLIYELLKPVYDLSALTLGFAIAVHIKDGMQFVIEGFWSCL